MTLGLTQSACSVFGVHSEENPPYSVLEKDEDFELRHYDSYVVAEVPMKGKDRDSRNQAFRRLANYIFGGNEGQEKISMTSPVVQGQSEGTRIAMTSPVTQSETGDALSMSFMMPSHFDLEDLPKTEDKEISFAVVAPRLIASRQFSGLSREEKQEQMKTELETWLSSKKQYSVVGEMSLANYDPPWTLPPMRRNEIHLELRTKDLGVYQWKHRLLVVSEALYADAAFLNEYHKRRSSNQERKLVLVPGEIPGYQLIGLDGSIKKEGPKQPEFDEIYELIDSMPMRQSELKKE